MPAAGRPGRLFAAGPRRCIAAELIVGMVMGGNNIRK